jgi:hypothetical protein
MMMSNFVRAGISIYARGGRDTYGGAGARTSRMLPIHTIVSSFARR